jgi:D-alanyl-D-alanine carboxypeptidase/D-alanyl-D-alanine-endopeptidase (penicillin-binding protein 4)
MVQKVGAQPDIDYHSQQMALPASTQKVITALAACFSLALISVYHHAGKQRYG